MFYFDNASTTKISQDALSSYVLASEKYFNPSALYEPSIMVKKDIEDARACIINKLKGAKSSTLIFTGSASEANNAVLNAHIIRKDKKYIFSAGEHSSIYNTAKHYEELGFNIVFVPLNKNGTLKLDALISQLDESVALVSIIHVSNETGAINDIKKITNMVKSYNKNIIVHSDGVQALGKLNINLAELGVDYYTISAHKINGPKGIGGLYIAHPNKFKPLIFGGGQEFNLRAGTENYPCIMAFKTAIEQLKICNYAEKKAEFVANLNLDKLIISDDECVDNIISVCFKGVRGETIQHILEQSGYLIGTGSACNSKAGLNRVIASIVPKEYAVGAVRISFGEEISKLDCKNLAITLTNAVESYREKINK